MTSPRSLVLLVVSVLLLAGCGATSETDPGAERSLAEGGERIKDWPPPEVLDLKGPVEPNVENGDERSVRAFVDYLPLEMGYGLRTTFLSLREPPDCMVCHDLHQIVRAAREDRQRYEFDGEWTTSIRSIEEVETGSGLPTWALLVDLVQPEMRQLDDTGAVVAIIPAGTRRTELVLRSVGTEWAIVSWVDAAPGPSAT